MTLFWYVLSTYWYVPVCTIIPFLYRSVLGTYWYVPYHCQYVLNTLILYDRSRFQPEMFFTCSIVLDKPELVHRSLTRNFFRRLASNLKCCDISSEQLIESSDSEFTIHELFSSPVTATFLVSLSHHVPTEIRLGKVNRR